MQAWSEGIHPVLVLNKVDRLITEKQMTPKDAYLRLWQVLEAVNAIIGELFASDVMQGRRDRQVGRHFGIWPAFSAALSQYVCKYSI